ncbi:MAG: hypothetical protein EXR78_10010, partial [Deltaproteobacteria bacterium]|nr:hypothetical protein [Deltaproteobacteria bacterium]
MTDDEEQDPEPFYLDEDTYFERLLKMSLDPEWENQFTAGVLDQEDADDLVEGITLADLPRVFAEWCATTGDPWAQPRWPSFAASGKSDDEIDRLEPEQAFDLLNSLRERAGQQALVKPGGE